MRMSATQAVENIEAREGFSDFKKYNNFKVIEGDSVLAIPLFKKAEDVEFFKVHQVRMVSSKGTQFTVDVDCPGGDCPLCREAPKYKDITFPATPPISRATDKIYLNLIEVTLQADGTYAFSYRPWGRFSSFYKNVLYPAFVRMDNPSVIEIVRTDKKTYNVYEARRDSKGNPFPEFDVEAIKKDVNFEVDDIYGRVDSVVKIWTKEQMEEYIVNPDKFPKMPAPNAKPADVQQEATPQAPVDAPAQGEAPVDAPRERERYKF